MKKFSGRKTGVARVLAALGEAAPATLASESPIGAEGDAAPALAVVQDAQSKPPSKRKGGPKGSGRKMNTSYPANKAGKEPRAESKRGKLFAILRDKGIAIDTMMRKFSWTHIDCRDALRLLGKQNGVATKCGDDGVWRVA
ncbi:MAG: hypothetical protein QM770_09485 [Tepidisphaeraceae bacterium]